MMNVVGYAYDMEGYEYLSKILTLEWVERAEELEGYHARLMILILPNDIQSNEVLVKKAIGQGNTVLLLQRLPLLASAKYYLGLGVRGYGNAMMHRVYFDAALETIRSGLIWLHPEFTAQLVGNLEAQSNREFLSLLSEREREIAILLLEGKTNQVIAEMLLITPRTVKAHASHLYHKLQVKDRLDFALRYK
ncbi:MAG: LuxR C-terminal-related transcriptional regulator [Sulfuricurvum sp.]|nr:LuxR C-terminal-related transcriptional regulator [Sulfuricurvum sp.]